MADRDDDDVLGVEQDRRKFGGNAPEDEGPPVAPMASTYGTALVGSEEEARRAASERTDPGSAPRDGLGEPQPPRPPGGDG